MAINLSKLDFKAYKIAKKALPIVAINLSKLDFKALLLLATVKFLYL